MQLALDQKGKPGMVAGLPRNEWLRGAGALPNASTRLFCFAHSGGGASLFREWPGLFKEAGIEVCPVQLPGREERLREKPFEEIGPLIMEMARNIQPFLDRPFALFGHSLGALIAFSLASYLEENFALSPEYLFVSGCRAPRQNFNENPIAGLPRDAFIGQVRRRYGGLPESFLTSPALLDIFIPALRADFSLLENYDYALDHPSDRLLDCPVRALGGESDRAVDEAELALWKSHTRGSFKLRMFEGDHFFIRSRLPEVVSFIHEDLHPANPT
ncbi:MAG TPA: alpha/beta fold hydrolase [Chloroflexia bacterium]|nr:alpha/beta fold hydrolase [Chloroflexia bacterium]